jgi:hypothetical protein
MGEKGQGEPAGATPANGPAGAANNSPYAPDEIGVLDAATFSVVEGALKAAAKGAAAAGGLAAVTSQGQAAPSGEKGQAAVSSGAPGGGESAMGQAAGASDQGALFAATQGMQETQMGFNLQNLQLQNNMTQGGDAGGGGAVGSGGPSGEKGQASTAPDSAGAADDLSQESQLKLQEMQDARAKAEQTLSDVEKKAADVRAGIVENLK